MAFLGQSSHRKDDIMVRKGGSMRTIIIVLVACLMCPVFASSVRGGAGSGLYDEGVRLLNAKNYTGAVEKLNQALQASPDNKALVYVALGKALFNLHRDEEARHAFEEALSINNGLVIARLGIAVIEASAGKCEQALLALDKTKDSITEIDEKRAFTVIQVKCDVSDKNKTIQRLTELIDLEGGRAAVDEYLYLWQLYSQTERYGHALDTIRKVLKISDTAANRERYAISLFNNGQIDESIAEYKKLIQKDPQIAEYHLGFANTLAAREDYGDADQEVSLAISLEPKNARFHYAKALIGLLKKDYQQCIGSAQIAAGLGDADIGAKALFSLGECYYEQGNIEEAVKQYETVARTYPKTGLAAFAKQLAGNISRSKDIEDQHRIKNVSFFKKNTGSSLSTAIKMVLRYWGKKNDLSGQEIAAIEFDGREPSLADAWLLLKAKGFDSIISAHNIYFIKILLKGGMPVILKERNSSNCVVVTGYDERRRTLSYNDPKMDNHLGQGLYGGRHDADILIIMPAKLKDGFIEQEKSASNKVMTELYDLTIFQASVGITNEKDGYLMAEKVYRLYPESHEAKLLLAERSYISKDYQKAKAYYHELLKNKDISSHVRYWASLGLAASYAKLGDPLNAKRYLDQAREIDPKSERAYELLLLKGN